MVDTLVAVAREFSPRYQRHCDDLVSIDVGGLDRLIGPPRAIGDALRRDAAARGVPVHVALARTRAAALVLALARPGLTVVEPGQERESLAAVPITILEKFTFLRVVVTQAERSLRNRGAVAEVSAQPERTRSYASRRCAFGGAATLCNVVQRRPAPWAGT